MQNIPAKTGIAWIRQGFALFRKQPAELSMLFLLYMLLMIVVSIIPIAGQLLPMILVPVFSMAFMQACVHIEAGKKIQPNLLLSGFRSPALGSLLQLGVLYLLAAIISVGGSSLIDGGVFWQLITNQFDPDTQKLQPSALLLGMLFSSLIFLPFCMAFWHAAPLIAWQRMSLFKAIFYSFFAVRRYGMAFMTYALGWIVVGFALPAIISGVLVLLLGQSFVPIIIMMPLSIILTIVMYCSFYPTYVQAFGRPESISVQV